jgi:hypothetical protein
MAITLTETRIEITDRHTTLCFLQDPSAAGPLGALDYTVLYAQVFSSIDATFDLISPKTLSPLLNRLFSICEKTNRRFWREYLDGVEFYPGLTLREGIPLRATIRPRLSLQLPDNFPAKVAPVIYVLLYPFGWSTWISLRVTKDHTVDDLASLLPILFQSKAWSLNDETSPMTLDDLFDDMSGELRDQVFAGNETRDRSARDRISMITVLSKNGSSYSYKSLNGAQQDQLKSLVTPKGPLSKRPLAERIYSASERRPEVNYLVSNNLARFLWMEDMLAPVGRQRQNLHCYHNNNFISLAQAWHLEGLLSATVSVKNPPAVLTDIIDSAIERLTYPKRKNASLREFLNSDAVKQALARHTKQDN